MDENIIFSSHTHGVIPRDGPSEVSLDKCQGPAPPRKFHSFYNFLRVHGFSSRMTTWTSTQASTRKNVPRFCPYAFYVNNNIPFRLGKHFYGAPFIGCIRVQAHARGLLLTSLIYSHLHHLLFTLKVVLYFLLHSMM